MRDIVSAHVAHQWVDIEALELFTSKEASSLLGSVRSLPSVEECVVLKTCNRVEVYTSTSNAQRTMAGLRELTGVALPTDLGEAVRFLTNRESLAHLLRVASGLESLIVGEDQILGQVKEAYEFAQKHGTIGPHLDMVFRKALAVGKKVRRDTGVNKGSVSIGSAAVRLAEQLLGDMGGRTVLVMGSGEMAGLVAKALAGKPLRAIFVANRTYWRAQELAKKLQGIAIRYEQLPQYIPVSDVIIAATGAPHIVLGREELEGYLGLNPRKEKLLIIDIGNPRNIADDVALVPNVELRNLDGLREIAAENFEKRRREVSAAEAIIEGELGDLLAHLEQGRADALAAQLYTRAETVLSEELTRLLRRLKGRSAVEEGALRDFARALVNRLMAGPTAVIKGAARQGDLETLRSAAKLFDLKEE
jgi:glutamyl-tRNA reductase